VEKTAFFQKKVLPKAGMAAKVCALSADITSLNKMKCQVVKAKFTLKNPEKYEEFFYICRVGGCGCRGFAIGLG
jgi:hypothetical protein